jgi:DNA-binding transcriptional ArsR family regulator
MASDRHDSGGKPRESRGVLRLCHFDDTGNTVTNRRVGQLSALGQEDRLEIFRLLVRAGPGGNCVDEIKRRLKIPGSTLSHHLDALTRSKLLNARRAGRFIQYAVNWREAAGLIRFLTEDCCADMHAKFAAAGPGSRRANAGDQSACRAEKQPAVRGDIRTGRP